ncbi:MAG: two-component regulator propeller domain-containing protein [Putridiphycobacter sp.]|nr:two-component regulator propeller domain-containing protein [Putridiphycobacter sp.]
MPQSQAYAINFDKRAYAWIGTQGGGIAIYDGETMRYLSHENGLISNRVYQLNYTDGQMFCAQKGGVTVLGDDLEIVKTIRFSSVDEIALCIQKHGNQIWVGSNKGLYVVEEDRFKAHRYYVDIQVNSFFIDEEKNLWIATNKGIWQVKDPLNHLNRSRGLKNENIWKVINYKGGWLIGTYGNGLYFYRQDKITRVENTNELNRSIIHDLVVQENKLWIATMDKGLFQLDNESNTLTQFGINQGLSNNHTRTLIIDPWGNLWIGTSGGGVSIFNNSPFVTYNKSNGLFDNYIYAVLKDKKRNLWVSTQGLGVQKINDSLSVLYNGDNGFKTTKSKAIFEDSYGRIWIGTEGEGLSVICESVSGDSIFNIKQSNGLSSSWVKCFTEDKKRNIIYVGTNNGVYSCRNFEEWPNDFRFNKQAGPISNSRITGLAYSETQQAVFFTCNDGAGYFKGKQIVFFDSLLAFRNVAINDSLAFFGSIEQGVLSVKIKNDSLHHKKWLTKQKGLLSHNVYQLQIDGQFLWIGTEKGLTKWHITNETYTHFGYDEGFEGVETNINAAFKDNEGQLWFGTTDGLFVYNAGKGFDSLQKLPPQIYFDDIQIYYQSISQTVYANDYETGKPLRLAHTDNHIGFSVKGHHFTFQNKIRYRWKLEGVDRDWSKPSKNKTVTFSNLQPGNYKFLVQGSIDNQWSMKPLAVTFTILTPFWQKPWFLISYILIGALAIFLIIYRIIKRQQQKNKVIIEKIELEKSILELEQKALRLQMNPHFIFNVLNSIHHLIILNDSAKARYALSKFSKLMRQVLENSREKLISIDAELDMLQNYIQLEKLTGSLDFDYVVSIDDSIDTNEPILPPLLVQPFIENAIIHGFKGIKYKGVIQLSFDIESDTYIVCTISDNGIGRENASKQSSQKDQYHKSTALQVVQERLSNLNESENKKNFEIIDQFDALGKPIGTVVILRLKLP